MQNAILKVGKVHRQINGDVRFMLIMAIAVIARVYISFFSGLTWYNTDTYAYFQMADAILAGKPISNFPNGFPIQIAIVKLIFNLSVVPTVLVLSNVVLSVLVVGMTTAIAKKMTGNAGIASLAGLCMALYPNQINYVRQILTEVPTTFFLIMGVFLLLRQKYFFSGLTLYLAVLFRSSLLPVLPILFVVRLFHTNTLTNMVPSVSFLGGIGLGLVLYAAVLAVGIVKPSDNLASNLLISIGSDSRAMNFSADNFTAEEKQHPFHTYVRFALENPAEYLKQRLLSLQELWGWPSAGDPPRSLVAKLLIALRLPLLILAIVGFRVCIHDFDAWVLFIPIVTVTLVHVAMFSGPRFTYVVEPCLVILAAMALDKISHAGWSASARQMSCHSE